MRYWGYLVVKLALAGGILFPLERLIARAFPPLRPFAQGGPNPLLRDVPYTFTLMFFSLMVAGVLWAIVWDQRYRCRTCLRRLRMPIQTGSWTNVLLGAPRTEYICPYGHGTLKVDQLQITGLHEAEWQPHDDMWKELSSLEETKK